MFLALIALRLFSMVLLLILEVFYALVRDIQNRYRDIILTNEIQGKASA